MNKVPFSKPSTTPQQQVALLQSRGIKISDSGMAEKFLCYHNYYHVSGYVFYFEVKEPIRTHKLARPATFIPLLTHLLSMIGEKKEWLPEFRTLISGTGLIKAEDMGLAG